MTKTISVLIKDKYAAWRSYKRSKSPEQLTPFHRIRNKVTSTLRSAECSYLQSLHRDARLTNSPDSVKDFWRYNKRVTGKVKASSIPDLETATSDWKQSQILEDSS